MCTQGQENHTLPSIYHWSCNSMSPASEFTCGDKYFSCVLLKTKLMRRESEWGVTAGESYTLGLKQLGQCRGQLPSSSHFPWAWKCVGFSMVWVLFKEKWYSVFLERKFKFIHALKPHFAQNLLTRKILLTKIGRPCRNSNSCTAVNHWTLLLRFLWSAFLKWFKTYCLYLFLFDACAALTLLTSGLPTW